MSLYLDTSIIVAALTNEAETRHVQHCLGDQSTEDLVISEWVITEFFSALSIKIRTGQIQVSHRADALAMFTRLCADSLTILPMSNSQFCIAARFADQYALGLRAGDALHLAVCADNGATLCTLDRGLGEAGPMLGAKAIVL